eukprot:TRINITY_DN6345_c0_g1_i1.p1 TRINITY_DN6345_c0_g1~~TRINITY_DN6345_c0_g1_i1.p1  ORF type:complete len:581 (-),score=78.64 TRINITY_DN6345_c0_g1_i1:69-1787(-)
MLAGSNGSIDLSKVTPSPSPSPSSATEKERAQRSLKSGTSASSFDLEAEDTKREERKELSTPQKSGTTNTNLALLLPPRSSSNPLDSELFQPIEIIFTCPRSRVAYELMLTEQKYVRNLYILIQTWKDPLASRIISRNITSITETSFLTLFGNIEDLILVNTTLLSSIIMRLKRWNETTTTIGDIFELLLPDLRQYNDYIISFPEACKVLHNIDRKEHIRQFLEQRGESNPLCSGLDLFAFLMMPIHRISRYQSIISSLLSYTPPDHPDHPPLRNANQNLTNLKISLVDAIKEAERAKRLNKIAKKFIDTKDFQIKQSGRHFFYDGALSKVCRKEVKLRHFFLFSDCLIYAYPQANNRYLPARQLALSSTFMVEEVSSKAYEHAFSIRHESKSFIVFAETASMKSEWMSVFKKVLADFKSPSSNDALAPVWIPDDATTTCTLCESKFTTFYRRHHCRQCGIVVCGPCSTKKKFLPGKGKKVKVCDKCITTEETKSPVANRTSFLFSAIAKSDFHPTPGDLKKLEVHKGERVNIWLVHPDGWFLAEKKGKKGWIPSNYLRECPPQFMNHQKNF